MASRSDLTNVHIGRFRSLYRRLGGLSGFETWLNTFEGQLNMGKSVPLPPNPTIAVYGDWIDFANSFLATATLDEIQSLEEWKAGVGAAFGDPPQSKIEDPSGGIPVDEPVPPGPFTILNSVLTGNLWVTAAFIIARSALGTRSIAAGTRILWTTLPGWARTALIALGVTEGANLVIEHAVEPDEGTALAVIGDLLPDILPFLHEEPVFGPIAPPGVTPMPNGNDRSGELVPVGTVITHGKRTHQIVSWWFANGVYFYRASDGWIGQRSKFGVWGWRFPRGGVVLNKVGGNDSANVLAALNIIEKEVNTAKKVLRAVGLKAVRMKSDG